MMREYISREAAINKLLQCADDYDPDYSDITVAHAISKIKEIPAADVVEVVRCKDCIHCQRLKRAVDMMEYCCETIEMLIDPENDYCSFAERRKV